MTSSFPLHLRETSRGGQGFTFQFGTEQRVSSSDLRDVDHVSDSRTTSLLLFCANLLVWTVSPPQRSDFCACIRELYRKNGARAIRLCPTPAVNDGGASCYDIEAGRQR